MALRVGYQDVSSFNRNFQKIMGVSPYQYKKNNSDYRGRVLDKKISAKKGWKHPSDP
ncbi:helix-turn-helix domain-containing protein [Escherichia coli]|uniref:helix-turn-helix domain-containing protein n=1 Tax=Escherichia coli TaxID=562 RepID=UPI003967BA3A